MVISEQCQHHSAVELMFDNPEDAAFQQGLCRSPTPQGEEGGGGLHFLSGAAPLLILLESYCKKILKEIREKSGDRS